jgi:hypothetical protein
MISRLPVALVLLSLAAAPAAPEAPGSYLLQTVLLLGSVEGETDLAGLPANVVEALEDVQKFLPYKAYRVIDVGVIRSSGSASGMLSGGVEGRQYEMEVRFEEVEGGRLDFRGFRLDSLELQPNDKVTTEGGTAKLEHSPPSWYRRRVIGTDFSVAVGETIVVGSSKLNGSGEALIVLFTATR